MDVQAIGADFYAFSGHKMLGPTGSGALWARRELLEAMPPFMAGGEMIREVHLRRSEWNDIPWKFEAGTPDIAAGIGLGAAAEYLGQLGMGRVREHERELLAYAFAAFAREHPDVDLYGPLDPNLRGGVMPFNVPGVHPHDVAQVLDRSGVAVRAGHHCTMPLHERLDLPATARASFNVYTTEADIDALIGRPPRGQAHLRRLRAPRVEFEILMDDLYRDYILEHYRRPHNFGVLDDPTTTQEGANPLCGDRITLRCASRDGQSRASGSPARLRDQPGLGLAADR